MLEGDLVSSCLDMMYWRYWIKIGEIHNGNGYEPYTNRKQDHNSFHPVLLYDIIQSNGCRDLKRNIIKYSGLKYPIAEKKGNNSY